MRKYYLIACEIMKEEINFCLKTIQQDIEVKIMPGSLHEVGSVRMQQEIQEEIDSIDHSQYEAILLCYGLCSNGIVNLSSAIPLVVPKVHDCISLLMGSKYKYQEYFEENPGTFFQSPGWIEKDIDGENIQANNSNNLGLLRKKEEYIEQYGEEEGLYLFEMLGSWKSEYKKITYIDTVEENADYYIMKAKKLAEKNQWKYEQMEGDTRLIFDLLNGNWNQDEFLIIPPNKKIAPSYDENIITY